MLNKYGIGLEQVRTVLASANANTPKGHFSDGDRMWEVGANDQIFQAVDYQPLIIAYHNGAAVRVCDVGTRWIRWKTCAMPATPTASRRCW